jgi:hypothetical protein
MGTMRRVWAAVSMTMGLAALAGCAEAPMFAGGAAKSPQEPPPAASYDPSTPAPKADAPAPAAPRAMGQDGDFRRSDRSMEEAPRKDRPGLGTEWGETRFSSISRVSFERADASSPFAALALFYNDQQGANAMASTNRAWTGSFSIASGLVTAELRDERGAPFRGFVSAGRSYVIGEAGHRYSIVLHNHTDHRFEVVLSVDGLDVMDGKSASFDKRGYILDPHGELEVDGFRQSVETVAAFRFGSVRSSYAEKKHGDSRNVGVIGVALFHERGDAQPVWSPDEIQRRRSANPFPGTFATPPGE